MTTERFFRRGMVERDHALFEWGEKKQVELSVNLE